MTVRFIINRKRYKLYITVDYINTTFTYNVNMVNDIPIYKLCEIASFDMYHILDDYDRTHYLSALFRTTMLLDYDLTF